MLDGEFPVLYSPNQKRCAACKIRQGKYTSMSALLTTSAVLLIRSEKCATEKEIITYLAGGLFVETNLVQAKFEKCVVSK
jgi:hypothetical protein